MRHTTTPDEIQAALARKFRRWMWKRRLRRVLPWAFWLAVAGGLAWWAWR